MMLTVALVAITATFVGLNLSRSDARLAELEAQRFVALVNMALDESIMTGRPILLTINTDAKNYQFAPLDVPAVFAKGDIEEDSDEQETPAYAPENDSFFRPRQLPERLKVEYTRLADRPEPDEDDGLVPQRVHEILSESLFDDERDEIENPHRNDVLIEPNGLISPFELALSSDDRTSRVGLDTFGKARLLEGR